MAEPKYKVGDRVNRYVYPHLDLRIVLVEWDEKRRCWTYDAVYEEPHYNIAENDLSPAED